MTTGTSTPRRGALIIIGRVCKTTGNRLAGPLSLEPKCRRSCAHMTISTYLPAVPTDTSIHWPCPLDYLISRLIGGRSGASFRRSQQQDLFLCDKEGCIYASWWSSGKDWSGITDKWSSIGGGIFPPGACILAYARSPRLVHLWPRRTCLYAELDKILWVVRHR